MVEIKNKKGEVIYRYDGSSLVGADLHGANLSYADLYDANLRFADLRNADLEVADLSYANLRFADLRNADLTDANISGANLSGAKLSYANLHGAYLRGVGFFKTDLSNADLSNAYLCGADFRNANLRGADFRNAELYDADLTNVIIDETTKGLNDKCPKTGSFIGYKKCIGKKCLDNRYRQYIVELEIPADARRSSSTTNKCRCDKAKVLSISYLDGSITDATEVNSMYNSNFKYELGKIVTEPEFDEKYWIECSSGIHFFMNRKDAVNYYL